jgi:hypothetical protein
MVFKILLRQIGFELFLLVAARRVILAIFVPTAMSSTMVIRTLDFPTMLIRLFGFSFLLVLVLLPMWYDCFNGCVRARSLGTAAQIRKKGGSLLVFTGL